MENFKKYTIDEITCKIDEETSSIKFIDTDECQLFIGANKQFPSKSHGEYFVRLNNTFYFIRIYKKPNFIKRFFMKHLLGAEFYETK